MARRLSSETRQEIANAVGSLATIAKKYSVSIPTVSNLRKQFNTTRRHKSAMPTSTTAAMHSNFIEYRYDATRKTDIYKNNQLIHSQQKDEKGKSVKVQTKPLTIADQLADQLKKMFIVAVKNAEDLKLVPQRDPNYIYREHAQNVVADLMANDALLIAGLPGTGKTSLLEQLAALTEIPLLGVSCYEGMTVNDLIGAWKLIEGQTVWVDGPLTTAMRQGYWFIIDEFDYAEAGVLGLLNKVTQPITAASPQRKLILAEKAGEVVVAHPNFRIVATANSIGNMQKYRRMFPNTRPMNFATLDRFSIYKVDWMAKNDEVDYLCAHFKIEKEHRAYFNKFVDLADVTRQAFSRGEGEMSFPVTTRRLIKLITYLQRHSQNHSEKNLVAEDRVLDGCKEVIFSICNDVEIEALTGYVRRVFAEKRA